MSFSPAQLEQLALRRRRVGTGHYYVRRHRTVLPRTTMASGTALASALGVSNGGGYPVYNLGPQWFRGGGRPTGANAELGQKLSRAVAPNTGYATTEYGPIRTVHDRAGWPRHGIQVSAEWLAMMNVKTWRVHGTVGPFSFDHAFGAGQIVAYTPSWTPPAADWVYTHDRRAAYGMGYTFSDSNVDGLITVTVRLGTFGTTPLDVLDEINESPSPAQLVPRLVVTLLDTTPAGANQATATVGWDSVNIGAGTEDAAVTFLGQPLRMVPVSGNDPMTGHSLAIEAASWWGPSDLWFGE